ncbi:MAG: acyl carrier protein [Candidatus Acidiferrales bacterium]
MADVVSEEIISILASVKRIPRERITLDSSLESLGLDSLDTITLLFELEKKFNITIPDENARKIRSVRDIVEGVRLLAPSPAPDSSVAPG